MKKKVAAIMLALLMTVMVIPVSTKSLVQAEDLYTAKSGATITAKGSTLRGRIPAGEKTFVVNITTKADGMVSLKPYISYNKTGDATYDQKIANLKTKVTTLKKDGTKEMGYYWNSKNGSFVEKATRTNEFTIANQISAKQDYGIWEKYVKKGSYQMVYTLPEEVTKGARIYLAYEILQGDKEDIDVATNTKSTAKVIRAGDGADDFNNYYYTFTYGSKDAYWFKIVSAGKRTLNCDIDGSSYISDKIVKLQLFDAKGNVVKEKVLKGERDADEGDAPTYLYYDYVELSIPKGTYYLKMSAPNEKTESSINADIFLDRAAKPKVTYWAIGKGVVRGKAEAGSIACAKINGKTYKAAKKTSAKGNFSIKIPKDVKAGTKIYVYVIDADQRLGEDGTTVKVQSVAKAPTIVCKKGTKTVSGKTYAKATVTVWYQGKKYTKTANSDGRFAIKTKQTLQAGKKVTVQVRRNSGNLSAKKSYTIKK